jgi:hypothetical protein
MLAGRSYSIKVRMTSQGLGLLLPVTSPPRFIIASKSLQICPRCLKSALRATQRPLATYFVLLRAALLICRRLTFKFRVIAVATQEDGILLPSQLTSNDLPLRCVWRHPSLCTATQELTTLIPNRRRRPDFLVRQNSNNMKIISIKTGRWNGVVSRLRTQPIMRPRFCQLTNDPHIPGTIWDTGPSVYYSM